MEEFKNILAMLAAIVLGVVFFTGVFYVAELVHPTPPQELRLER